MPSLPILQPSSVTLMIKPVGALCNLDCTYCYYLPTKEVYDGHEHKMSLSTLESIFAGFLPHAEDEVTIAWQGGEPTLAGLKFFENAIEFQEKYRKPGQRIEHALQTNGTLLNDEWCRFLREHDFLIGLSIDGPPQFHDYYRLSNAGRGTHDQVARGLKLLQKHDVQYNLLCVLNNVNVNHPQQVYNYLLGLGSRWLQFIPAIEWEVDENQPGRNRLADYSPDPIAYGKFLCEVFDLWFERHRQRVSIRIFDAVLAKLVMDVMPFCILNGSCHSQVTIEHNGDVYGCDHFIERRWRLARIGEPQWRNEINIDGTEDVGLTIHGTGYRKNAAHEGRDIRSGDDLDARYAATAGSAGTPGSATMVDDVDAEWFSRADAQRLGGFAVRKQHLPQKCVQCQWKPYCHGGCPKHRSAGGEVPEPTALCEAYIMFYEHAMPRMEWLADYLRRGQQPPPCSINERMGYMTDSQVGRRVPVTTGVVGRNDPCPCGSGLKYKKCCGRER